MNMATASSAQHLGFGLLMVPILALLFFGAAWPQDPRTESDEERLKRYSRARAYYMSDVLWNLYQLTSNERWEERAKWNALLPWLEKDRRAIEAKMKPVEAALVPPPAPVKPDPNAFGSSGQTPLTELLTGATPSQETASQHTVKLKALLAGGADPSKRDRRGITPVQAVLSSCRHFSAVGSYKYCVQSWGNEDLCRAERLSITDARSNDRFLLESLKLLVASGADLTTTVPKEFVELQSTEEQPRDVSLREYAAQHCPDFIVNVIDQGLAKK